MRRKVVLSILIIVSIGLTACTESGDKNKETNSSSSHVGVNSDSSDNVPAGVGEGAPPIEALDLSESKEYKVGEKITFEGQAVSYELSIDTVEYTEERDEYTQNPENVLLITYTYENMSDETLLIDDMRFQLMSTDQSILYSSYYFQNILVPDPISKGETCTAQVAYIVDERAEQYMIAYQDTVNTEFAPVKVDVMEVTEK